MMAADPDVLSMIHAVTRRATWGMGPDVADDVAAELALWCCGHDGEVRDARDAGPGFLRNLLSWRAQDIVRKELAHARREAATDWGVEDV